MAKCLTIPFLRMSTVNLLLILGLERYDSIFSQEYTSRFFLHRLVELHCCKATARVFYLLPFKLLGKGLQQSQENWCTQFSQKLTLCYVPESLRKNSPTFLEGLLGTPHFLTTPLLKKICETLWTKHLPQMFSLAVLTARENCGTKLLWVILIASSSKLSPVQLIRLWFVNTFPNWF